jgi:hypothetical protein
MENGCGVISLVLWSQKGNKACRQSLTPPSIPSFYADFMFLSSSLVSVHALVFDGIDIQNGRTNS